MAGTGGVSFWHNPETNGLSDAVIWESLMSGSCFPSRCFRYLGLILLSGLCFASVAYDQTIQPDDEQEFSDESLRYGAYNRGMASSDIPEEFQTTLTEMLAEVSDLDDEFERVLNQRRQQSPWLDQALDDPEGTPLLTDDGNLPGPTTRELVRALQPLYDAFVADYEQNSSDSVVDKKIAIDRFRKVMTDVCIGDPPDKDSIAQIQAAFEAGDVDPITLYPLLNYQSLSARVRRQCLQSVAAALKLRPCSSLTKFMLVSAMRTMVISNDDRIRCTVAAIESVAEVLQQHHSVGPQLDYFIYNVTAVMNPAGYIDYLTKVLEQDTKIVPAHLRHYLVSGVYERIAMTARGSDFISNVAREQLKVFEGNISVESLHLLKAWSLAPNHPLYPKELLSNEMRSGTTPLSTLQWYRIALSTQADARSTTKAITRALQPRWGGSMQSLEEYSKQLIAMGKKPGVRLLFDIPMTVYFGERSLGPSTSVDTEFDELLLELLDHWEALNGDQPDSRLRASQAIIIVRLLWDAGELDRLDEFMDRYQQTFEHDQCYSLLVPAWLVDQVMAVRKHYPSEAWDVLQKELLVGPETFDEQRWERINKAMRTVRELVPQPSNDAEDSGESREVGEAADGADENQPSVARQLLHQYEVLHNKIRAYHDGEEVDFILGGKIALTRVGYGAIQFNDDSIDIDVSCQSNRLIFFTPLRFQLPLVVEMDVVQGECDADAYGIALFVGPVSTDSTASSFSGRSLRYATAFSMAMQDRLPSEFLTGENFVQKQLSSTPEKATLKMEARSTGTRSYVNDELISETDYPLRTGGNIQFGRWSNGLFDRRPAKSASYKITSIRVRRLDSGSSGKQ